MSPTTNLHCVVSIPTDPRFIQLFPSRPNIYSLKSICPGPKATLWLLFSVKGSSVDESALLSSYRSAYLSSKLEFPIPGVGLKSAGNKKTYRNGCLAKQVAAAILLLIVGMAYTNPIDAATFKSVRAAHDAALDTNPNSAFWAGAPPVFLDADNYGHSIPWLRTTVRSRWTNENLYIFFVCPYRELHLKPSPDTRKQTNELWNWDVAEMFLGSDFENIDHYKEFEMSPQGEWLDLDIHLNDPRHARRALRSGFQVAARIDRNKKIWYGVMRIPFAAIDSKSPYAGERFRVNLLRSQGPSPNTRLLAWQAPMSDTFHKPERFGTLELTDK